MQRDFKGIWIPKEIWFYKGLTITEKIFLSEVDSLDKGEGCYAKNRHFAELFSLSKNRCSEIISSLSEKGFLRTFFNDDGLRRLVLITPFGISNPPSESRLTPSESRLTPSESRLPYKDREIQLENQEREGAHFFLKVNFKQRWEAFEMQNKKAVSKWDDLLLGFDDKVVIEKLPYDADILFARLGTYTRQWRSNEGDKINATIKPTYLRKIS